MLPRAFIGPPSVRLVAAAAAVATALASGAAAGAGTVSLDAPRTSELARAGTISDTTLAPAAARSLAAAQTWGGTYTTAAGDSVHIQVSDSYPQDDALAQRWADFLGSLVHGPEISTVNVYLAPLNEVQRFCGRRALACYNQQTAQLVAPGDDPSSDTSAEAVVAHEYGHHVAANRSNAPWDAGDYGTKRWATYENVCSRTRAGTLFPGAEDTFRYEHNPGEAFAEQYRVLNQQLLGQQVAPWDVVADDLAPDQGSLDLLKQDVLQPWTQNTVTAVRGTAATARTYAVATPEDGMLTVTAKAPARGRLTVSLLNGSGTVVSQKTAARGGTTRLAATVCGTRGYTVRVAKTTGQFLLQISKP